MRKIEQNTAAKDSFQITVNGNSSALLRNSNHCTSWKKGADYEIAFLNLETYYSFPNIDTTNNNFKYSPDSGSSWFEVQISEGCYEVDNLNDAVKHLIICPIAIAYSMGQIIKSVCVCLSVRLCVCVCLSVWLCVVTLTVAFLNELVGGQYRPIPSPILPLKIAIFDPEILKINANMKNAISALNVHVSPKFLHFIGNFGQGTRW